MKHPYCYVRTPYLGLTLSDMGGGGGTMCPDHTKINGESDRVRTASCQSGSGINTNSGGKRRYCELGDRETGGQPNKAQKHNLLPGITNT